MKEKIVRGIPIGIRDNGVLIKNKEEIYFVPEEELGGVAKNNKAANLMGVELVFVPIEQKEGVVIASRKKALEIFEAAYKPEVGAEATAKIICILKNKLVVECFGKEVYIPTKECTYLYEEDLKQAGTFKVNDNIKVVVTAVDPLEVSHKQTFEDGSIDLYKIGDTFDCKCKARQETNYILELPLNKKAIMCFDPKWAKPVEIDEIITITISKIDEEKNRIFGYMKGRGGRWS